MTVRDVFVLPQLVNIDVQSNHVLSSRVVQQHESIN